MSKRGTSHAHETEHHSGKIEDKVLHNLIELQKIQVNLTEKFDKLSDQIAKLLALFEMAAKSFAQNPAVRASEKDSEFLDKINALLDQNKTIAKGLTIMEERIRERVYGAPKPAESIPGLEKEPQKEEKKEDYTQSPSSINRPLPRF